MTPGQVDSLFLVLLGVVIGMLVPVLMVLISGAVEWIRERRARAAEGTFND